MLLIAALGVVMVTVQMSPSGQDDLFKQHAARTVQSFAGGDLTTMCRADNVLSFESQYATCTATRVGASDAWSVIVTYYYTRSDAENDTHEIGRALIIVEQRRLTSVAYQRAGGTPFE